jgi:competence CoiA-like predicted nuclease
VAKTEKLKTEITELRQEVLHLRNCIKTANHNNDDIEQYDRRMMLDISNIPGDTGNHQEDVDDKIVKFANSQLDISLSAEDIDKAHRIGRFDKGLSRKRRIIVKFTNSKARQRVYNKRKSAPDGIFIQESLTQKREQLAYEARKLKRENKLQQTLVAGGNINGIMLINSTEKNEQ